MPEKSIFAWENGDFQKKKILVPRTTEIDLGILIFGFSASNYMGSRSSRPNPCPEDLFRDHQKISILESLIFELGKAEIGIGSAIFGISSKSYNGFRNYRPNPWLGGLFRGHLSGEKKRYHTKNRLRLVLKTFV